MDDEAMDDIWKEIIEEEAKYKANCERINNRIFKAIENQIGAGFLKDLKYLIEESEIHGSYRIVQEIGHRNTRDMFQHESDYGCITGIWVHQYSVGDSGDSFAGQIWVKLKNWKYLEMDFSC